MSPISDGSKRCLLQENEVCALLDLQAGNTNDDDNPFRYQLPFMIFNLEKPIGCKEGTQCRFQAGNTVSPLCYSSSGSPSWITGPQTIGYGKDCTLQLYSKNGMCYNDDSVTDNALGPVTCYNYGLSPKNKTGLCSYSSGVYGGAAPLPYVGFTLAYITPRFVPIQGKKLRDYQDALGDFVLKYQKMRAYYAMDRFADPCNVRRTDIMIPISKFYFGLKKAPVQGMTFVATEAELDAKLIEAQDVVKDADTTKEKVCRVYLNHVCKVDPKGTVDANGNDGKCDGSNPNENNDFTDPEESFSREYSHRNERDHDEDYIADDRITKYEVMECSNSPGGGSTTFQCPENFTCYEDYNDYQMKPLYDESGYSCGLRYPQRVRKTCHDVAALDAWKHFGACEMEVLKEKVEERLYKELFRNGYLKLGLGKPCEYEVEKEIWSAMKDPRRVNGYRFITKDFMHDPLTNGFCDRARLLVCKKDKVCGCRSRTAPRLSADGQYKSEYCYYTEGSCARDVTEKVYWKHDKADAIAHYGKYDRIEPPCNKSNVCVFINEEKEECTSENTGKTGVEPKPKPGGGGGGGDGDGDGGGTGTGKPGQPDRTNRTAIRPIAPARPYNGINSLHASYIELILIFVSATLLCTLSI